MLLTLKIKGNKSRYPDKKKLTTILPKAMLSNKKAKQH